MTTQKSAAARKAVAESSNKSVKIEFLGHLFEGPPTLPSTFEYDALEADAGVSGSHVRLFLSILGEDQWVKIREVMAEHPRPAEGEPSPMEELSNSIMEAYGVGLGE